MVRKIASQVPEAMSRLIQSGLITHPPTWYNAVLANPPPVIPARQTTARSRPEAKWTHGDLPVRLDARREGRTRTHHAKQFREPKPKPADIVYDADRVRRQFFADFPFEALRPVSLVEADTIRSAHAVRGKSWTSLAQRGRYPTVEDVVEFTLTLHESSLPMTEAYARATAEFVALRAQHEMATHAAAAEARHYGASFKRDEWERTFWKEGGRLEKVARSRQDTSSGPLREGQSTKHRKPKVWSADVNPLAMPAGGFTGGIGYAQRWTLPPKAEAGAAKPAGDLVSAIKPAQEPAGKNEDEMDDLELMAAILGGKSNA